MWVRVHARYTIDYIACKAWAYLVVTLIKDPHCHRCMDYKSSALHEHALIWAADQLNKMFNTSSQMNSSHLKITFAAYIYNIIYRLRSLNLFQGIARPDFIANTWAGPISMDDEMLTVASQQTLSLFITEGENFCLDEGRCFSTDNTLHFRAAGPWAGGCGL